MTILNWHPCGLSGMSEGEKVFVSEILKNVKTHEKSLESFQHDHCCQARCIEDKAQETFQQRYMVSCFSHSIIITLTLFTLKKNLITKLSHLVNYRSMRPQGQLRQRVSQRSQLKTPLNHYEQCQWRHWLKCSVKTTLMNPLRPRNINFNS